MASVSYKEIQPDEAGQRLDNYLLRILKGVPRSMIYRIIRSGEVRVNQKRARPDTRLQAHDRIRIPPVRVSETSELAWSGQKAGHRLLDSIIYEDDRFLVINKPSGIAVHGGSGLSFGVIEALRHARQELHYLELVHRIDRETSGCLVLAKKRSALRALHRQFEARQVEKKYWALVYGSWQHKTSLQINEPLKKNQLQSGERMVHIDSDGKPSITQVTLMKSGTNASYIVAEPLTGRTHQIRVHCASLGHAIIGDEKYCAKADTELALAVANRLYLHARSIRFTLEGQEYFFEAPLDQPFDDALGQLGLRN